MEVVERASASGVTAPPAALRGPERGEDAGRDVLAGVVVLDLVAGRCVHVLALLAEPPAEVDGARDYGTIIGCQGGSLVEAYCTIKAGRGLHPDGEGDPVSVRAGAATGA